jgi:hypothetical protein
MSSYPLGQAVRISTGTITGDAGPVDPATLTVTISLPDTTTETFNLSDFTRSSVGVFHYDYLPAQAGGYDWRIVSTVPNAASEGSFTVDTAGAHFDEPVTLEDAKAHVNKTTTTDDAELQRMLDAAMARISYEVGPLSPKTFVEEHIDDAPFILRKQPAQTFTAIAETPLYRAYGMPPTAPYPSTWRLIGGVLHRTSGWSPYFQTVATITYTAGWNPLPEDIRQAVLELTRHLWSTQQGSRASSSSGPPMRGSQEQIMAGMSYTLPNRVKELLEPYRQRTRAA